MAVKTKLITQSQDRINKIMLEYPAIAGFLLSGNGCD